LSETRNQNYLHGAAILAISVIIIKILGAIYKIPMGNILGDEGFTHFNVAYNLYNVLLTISTAGLPVAVSKMISEANTLGKPMQVRRIFRVSLAAFTVLGTAGTLIMFIYPTELAVFMEDVEAAQSIKAMAPSVLIVCIMSAFRGYTQGHSDMRPTSISQVIEVAVKVAFGLALAWYLSKQGKSLPILSAAAISGVAVGSLAACLYICLHTMRGIKRNRRALPNPDVPERSGKILKKLIKIGVPIALGSSVLSVITLVNTKLILGRLQSAAGLGPTDALVLFGVYSKAMTLYNLPAAFITPLTVSVVPAIAAHMAKKSYREARVVAESSLRISSIIALPMGVGLSVLCTPIMNVLYPGSASQGPLLLSIMGIASFFVCTSLITTSILQAGGLERLPMITMVIGGAINLILNWFLVGNPKINIVGAPVGTLCCYVFMSGLNLIFIMTSLPEKPRLGRAFLLPAFNCAIMGLVAWLLYPAILGLLGAGPQPERLTAMIAMVGSIAIAVLVYLFLTISTRAITIEDMKLIPKGEKIARLLKIH